MPPDPASTSGRQDPGGDRAAAREAAAAAHTAAARAAPAATSTPATLPVLESVARYRKHGRIGEGTYGVVYKATDTLTGQVVALKRLRMGRAAPGGDGGGGEYGRDGMPLTSVRELACLQAAARSGDPHVVRLLAVVTDTPPDAVFLVFEYCPYDLAAVLDASPTAFSMGQVKHLVRALLEAVEGLHARFTLHRDVKPSNILLTDRGVLKLCDCGLARPLPATGLARLEGVADGDEDGPVHCPPLSAAVQTLWYRAPELLWGSPTYGDGIDVWSVGCVMGELLAGRPLFPERTVEGVVKAQAALLGSPARVWPGLARLPGWRDPPGGPRTAAAVGSNPFNYVASTIGARAGLSRAGCDLLNALLVYDPAARLSARGALTHPWFREEPVAGREGWVGVARAAERALAEARRERER